MTMPDGSTSRLTNIAHRYAYQGKHRAPVNRGRELSAAGAAALCGGLILAPIPAFAADGFSDPSGVVVDNPGATNGGSGGSGGTGEGGAGWEGADPQPVVIDPGAPTDTPAAGDTPTAPANTGESASPGTSYNAGGGDQGWAPSSRPQGESSGNSAPAGEGAALEAPAETQFEVTCEGSRTLLYTEAPEWMPPQALRGHAELRLCNNGHRTIVDGGVVGQAVVVDKEHAVRGTTLYVNDYVSGQSRTFGFALPELPSADDVVRVAVPVAAVAIPLVVVARANS